MVQIKQVKQVTIKVQIVLHAQIRDNQAQRKGPEPKNITDLLRQTNIVVQGRRRV